MPKPDLPLDYWEWLADLEHPARLPPIKNAPRPRPGPPVRLRRRKPPRGREVRAALAEDDTPELAFTYRPSKTERAWLLDSLGYFHEQRWIDDVLRQIKGGKEASVYQCAADASTGMTHIAAKVYRPRRFRQLRNDHLYREGRAPLDEDGLVIIDDGMLQAMKQRTPYGQELTHISWIEHEVRALRVLHAAGADVPLTLASGKNAILMSYIGGPLLAAPTLNTVDLAPDEARRLFQRVLDNVDLMLAQDLIHGDLSAYNILYWEGEITLIDFPQAISPHINRNAYAIFQRDLARTCGYFARQGLETDPERLAADLWAAHHLAPEPDVHPGLLDDQDEGNLAYWRQFQERSRP